MTATARPARRGNEPALPVVAVMPTSNPEKALWRGRDCPCDKRKHILEQHKISKSKNIRYDFVRVPGHFAGIRLITNIAADVAAAAADSNDECNYEEDPANYKKYREQGLH
jgi:hypothetical protein